MQTKLKDNNIFGDFLFFGLFIPKGKEKGDQL